MSQLLEQNVDTVSESVAIVATAGNLAGVLSYPQDRPTIGRLVVAGPHPLLGGTMENNVVRAVAEGMAAQGWITLRFDYRGVGNSEGPSMCDAEAMQSFWKTSEVHDECERWTDLRDASRWLCELDESMQPLVVVAYSFGNWVLSHWLEQNGKPDVVVGIAPTLDQHDLKSLAQTSVPKLVLAAEADFATRAESIQAALPSWKNTKTEWATDRDGHFFRGHEPWLCQRITNFLSDLQAEASP
ncbi:MAG: alpha/beta fold hydrolase [Planctomycetes bacterium]|nr:alpha/beta fold hydrolase [Planctomycetota bacterium]